MGRSAVLRMTTFFELLLSVLVNECGYKNMSMCLLCRKEKAHYLMLK